MQVREPVARPLDVVALELLLSAAQAFLVGVLLYVAVGFWEDRGVGLGSVAVVLVLMGLAVGAGWLYWLLGGVGWPMTAANSPVALFLGVTLVLGWVGDGLVTVRGAPILLAEVCAVYGVVAGVFLDSPRRRRWDQRERLRPGAQVPRLSPTTRALVAAMPRSLPRRKTTPEPMSELAARIEGSTPARSAGEDRGGPQAPDAATLAVGKGAGSSAAGDAPPEVAPPTKDAEEVEAPLTDVPAVTGAPLKVPEAPEPTLPVTSRARAGTAVGAAPRARDDADDGGIELPTMVEPRAQRSPWAWAAPPEWNRDDEDDVPVSSKHR